MKYYLPTKVISETNCVERNQGMFLKYGTRCLIVTGKQSARKNGALDDVIAALTKHDISYTIFDEIEENPSVQTVIKGASIGIDHKVEFVIGIGGGSPLDASKAIALLIQNPNESGSLLFEKKAVEALPVIAIPTTAGTGSEVTQYAILTVHEEKTKKGISHEIFPKIAFVDSKYLKSASREIIVNTAVDALAHLVESYLNANSNVYNRMFSEQGLRIFAGTKEALLSGKVTDFTYKQLMEASTMAGMAIAHTGTSLPHGLSYAVTYHLGVAHGKAVGIFLGNFMELFQQHQEEDAKRVIELLNFHEVKEFKQFISNLLGEVVIDANVWSDTVDAILQNPAKLKNCPFDITKEMLMKWNEG